MLDKIVLSNDRHTAIIHFSSHSVCLYDSERDVMELVFEIILEPAMRIRERYRIAEEDTVEIDLQLTLFKEEAA